MLTNDNRQLVSAGRPESRRKSGKVGIFVPPKPWVFSGDNWHRFWPSRAVLQRGPIPFTALKKSHVAYATNPFSTAPKKSPTADAIGPLFAA
jgi:hypothetical protein